MLCAVQKGGTAEVYAKAMKQEKIVDMLREFTTYGTTGSGVSALPAAPSAAGTVENVAVSANGEVKQSAAM